jgi:hypothetical protein
MGGKPEDYAYTWGMDNGRWPTRLESWQHPNERVRYGDRINWKDWPTQPRLNRKCHEGNILQTIVAEYDTVWPEEEYLELYYQVYRSISNRIILKITRKGLEDANNKAYDEGIIAQTIASYLPSGLPIDKEGMKKMAEELFQSRKMKRLDKEIQLQRETNLMELG